MAARRAKQGPVLVTIWWRDIPAQVNAQVAGRREQRVLDPRFLRSIQRAAKRAELTDVHDFTKQWRRTEGPLVGDPVAAADAARQRLEMEYPETRLRELIRSGGVDRGPELGPGSVRA